MRFQAPNNGNRARITTSMSREVGGLGSPEPKKCVVQQWLQLYTSHRGSLTVTEGITNVRPPGRRRRRPGGSRGWRPRFLAGGVGVRRAAGAPAGDRGRGGRRTFTLDMAPSPRVMADACADLLERMGWLFVAYLYEDAAGLERLQELEREDDMSDRKLLAFDLSEDDVWSELVESGYRNIIIDVDESRIEDVLMQAQEAGLVTEIHSYLLVSLDAHVPGSRPALRQAMAEARVYSFRMLELDDYDFTLLGRRLVRQHPELTAGGREKQVSYDGFTGEVNFDEGGERELDDLRLFEWHRGRSEHLTSLPLASFLFFCCCGLVSGCLLPLEPDLVLDPDLERERDLSGDEEPSRSELSHRFFGMFSVLGRL
ncbi:hypothetical protein HPB49_008168 [Dermacentor silvarum]|uniref:Uncharacterized protein n=1 Tax=Dermacentor silvarum TaxID=543639 RepID=A0ACB8C8E5_DERSI|nr:hypothetical protein HPB49_008168 [Dermacentor silvarum]